MPCGRDSGVLRCKVKHIFTNHQFLCIENAHCAPFLLFIQKLFVPLQLLNDISNMAIGITEELAKLRLLRGAAFVKQLKVIAARNEFHPLLTDPDILSVGGDSDADYQRLLNAARKAVSFGYRVYMLPNPHDFRTADFIFERKGNFTMYDLKTVYGKGSVETQLTDSFGQTNRVLLNMATDYNARLLASDIKAYFESNHDAVEVLIFKGSKAITVKRGLAANPEFNRIFRKLYEK